MGRRCSIQQGEKITVDQSKVLKIDRIDCSVFSGPPGIAPSLQIVFHLDKKFKLRAI